MTGDAVNRQPQSNVRGLPIWQVAAVTLVFGSVSLWDFYIGEVRLFDFAALLLAFTLLVLASITRVTVPKIDSRSVPLLFGVFTLVLVYALVGVGSHPDNLKPSLGMLLGVLVLALARGLVVNEQLIDRSITWIGWVHIFAFFLQFISFYLTREVVNFHSIVGLQPRLVSTIFRAAGLFLEPAIYCFFAASIFLVRRQRKRAYGLLDALLLVSMFLSFSLWGAAVGFLLLVLFRFKVALIIILVLTVITVIALGTVDVSHFPIYQFFERRLTSLGSDTSALGRYGGTFAWIVGVLSDRTILFGNGINNFFEEHGSNGWTFILNSMGLIGTSILFSLLLFLTSPRRWLLFAVSFGILLSAAPLWKTLYFWFWIALMLIPNRGNRPIAAIDPKGLA